MSNDEDKPKFELIDFTKKKKEFIESSMDDQEEWENQLLQCYAYSRSLLIQIEDEDIKQECLKHLRNAYMPIFDPFVEIDMAIDLTFEDEEIEE